MNNKGEISNFRVVGGKLISPALKVGLDENIYDVVKMYYWLEMLKDSMVPVKWMKATKKGTKVIFNYPQSQDEWDKSYHDLKSYMKWLNQKYGLNYSLTGSDSEVSG